MSYLLDQLPAEDKEYFNAQSQKEQQAILDYAERNAGLSTDGRIGPSTRLTFIASAVDAHRKGYSMEPCGL